MSSCVCKILFKLEQICGCCCKMLRGLLFWDTRGRRSTVRADGAGSTQTYFTFTIALKHRFVFLSDAYRVTRRQIKQRSRKKDTTRMTFLNVISTGNVESSVSCSISCMHEYIELKLTSRDSGESVLASAESSPHCNYTQLVIASQLLRT